VLIIIDEDLGLCELGDDERSRFTRLTAKVALRCRDRAWRTVSNPPDHPPPEKRSSRRHDKASNLDFMSVARPSVTSVTRASRYDIML
jgi:hypothetical protein